MALDNGFSRKQFSQIRSEIEEALVDSLGRINLLPPSVFANIITVFAEREANLWEQLEAVYNASYPASAEGYSLDGICALTGVIRASSTYSEATCQLTAVNYTKIPARSEVLVQNTENIFTLLEDITVTNEKCHSITIKITSNTKDTYTLTIDSVDKIYTKEQNDTIKQIAINLAAESGTQAVDAVAEGEYIIVTSKEAPATFSCFIGEGMTIDKVINNALFQSSVKGSIVAPALSLNTIVTPVLGWLAVSNKDSVIVGNDLETDVNLRSRRGLSLKLPGSGTLESIRASLLNLNTVTAVSILENNTGAELDGLPAHSFSVLITGGDDNEIAQVIWEKKPAGIASFAIVSSEEKHIKIFDSSGKEQIINFSRPTKKYVRVVITIKKTIDFLAGADGNIKDQIIAQINSLGVNSNVILKSLYAPIFAEIGVASAVIELGATTNMNQNPQTNEADIVIEATEVAFTEMDRIEITLEDF